MCKQVRVADLSFHTAMYEWCSLHPVFTASVSLHTSEESLALPSWHLPNRWLTPVRFPSFLLSPLKAEPIWLSQSLLVHRMLKPPRRQVELHQKIPVCRVLASPKLDTGLQVQSQVLNRVEEKSLSRACWLHFCKYSPMPAWPPLV